MELTNFCKILRLTNISRSPMRHKLFGGGQIVLTQTFAKWGVKEEPTYATIDDDYETIFLEKEQQLERSRNKSGLRDPHRNMLHNQVPYSEPKNEAHLTIRYKRKLFGRYGHQSAINPGALWPNQEDINKIIEYEKIAFPYSLQESICRQKQKIEHRNALVEARQNKILMNLQKLDQWKKDMEARQAKKLADLARAKAKKDALIEEVKKHFGYKVEMHEERFKEMLLVKEKAMKKKLKEERTKAKHEQMLAGMTKNES